MFQAIDAIDAPPLAIPPTAPQTTVIGLYVGDLLTPPSLVAVRYDPTLLTPGDPMFGEAPIFETRYLVLGAQTLDALSFPAVAKRLNSLARGLYDRDSRGDYHVLVDATDVGRPVVDAIRDAIVPQVHVTSVRVVGEDRGDLSILWRNNASIGLGYLISRVQAILQGNRLSVPESLTDLTAALSAHTAGAQPAPLLRALALAVASEYMPVGYDVSPDDLPSPVL